MSDLSHQGRSQIINVVSGKGGTGKSLLTAILGRALAKEGLSVLLVDFDIAVRGLTILLLQSALGRLARGKTVADILGAHQFSEDSPPGLPEKENYAIGRFLECDVMPAVADISSPLDYDDPILNSQPQLEKILDTFLSDIRKKYNIVLIDNRAGIDSVVLASCRLSDLMISVAEDDEVSLQANTNLINHMRYREKITGVYTIINKARRIFSVHDIKSSPLRRVEFSYLGVIPFDSEVFSDYGTNKFWETIYQTLYFRGVIETWNELARLRGLTEISESKYNLPPQFLMRKRLGRFALVERAMLLYGSLIVSSAVGYWLYRNLRRADVSLEDIYLILGLFIGGLMIVFPILGFRRLLVGQAPFEDSDGKRERKS